MCTEQDALSLFTVTDDEKAESIWDILWTAIRKSPPDDNTSENGFISFWDDNIRYIIMIAIVGTVIRDSNRNMSTGLQRPDFGLLMGGICTFRGEEKPTVYDGRHPRDELVEKLTYTYSPAPYIIGQAQIYVNHKADCNLLRLLRHWSPDDCRSYIAGPGEATGSSYR